MFLSGWAALRQSETLSAAEIADIALADRAIEDMRVRATFVSRFHVPLDQVTLCGHIERIGSGQGVCWRLASGS